MWLSFLIHRPIAVLTLTFLLVFLGLSIIFLDKLKVDILPEMEIEKLMVSIDHSSNAIEQNDLLRKMQLLVNSLHRLENVTDVRAATLVDKTLIKISYLPQLAKQNRKLEAIRFLESYWIQEKINLPPPFIYEGGVDGLPIAYYALSFKENIPIFKSKQILELEIIPALQQLSGTSIIDLSSQSQYELAIEWKAETIATYGQNISQFEDQLKSLLTPRQTIKQIDNHNSETIQFEGIQKNLDKIKNATLYYNFNKSILKDLANVEIKEVTPRPITIDGKNKPVYIFKIFSSDGNIIKNNEEIKASLSSFSDKYGLSYETFENNSDLLNISLANIISSIVLALLIVSVLVIVLYKNLYLALSIVFTMVATFAISCLLMYLGSIEISLVSLLAIYLVIGLLVDYTVIILESTIINKQDLTETSIVKNVSSVNAGLWGAMLTNFLVFIPFIFLANKLGFFIKEFVIVLSIFLTVALISNLIVLPLLLYLFKNKINTFSKKSIDLINLSKTNSLIVLLTSMTIFFLLTQIEKKSLPEFPVVGLWLYSNKTFKSDLIKEIEDLPNYKSLYYSSGNSSFLTQNFNQFSFKNWMFINFNEKTDINEVRLKLAKFDVLLEPEINPFSEIFDETGLGLNSKIVPESYLRSIENNNSSFLGGPMTMYKKTYIPHLNQELSLKNLEDYMVNTHKGKLLGSINQSIYSMEVLSKYNPNIANTNNYTLKGFDIRSLFDIKTAEEWYPKITTKESQGVNIYTKDLDMQKIDSEGLGWYFVISVLILYVIILVQFESFVISLSMMSLVVISLFGGLLGLYIADITLNTMSILGLFVTVGVGVNDVILKAEGIQNNLKSGLSLDESINESSNSRLRPILFTSLTTLVSLVPIFFQENSISTSIVKSLAVPLFYGLIFSTIYSLIFINNSLKWAFNISIKKGI